ncbi:hypothetical protein DFH07DRAFT_865935 [Mycena maculata]|uniref:CxC1-like cysteine cluster associated with KDZ transposases domain-containing protein n=1 Tax=Mycena maculata TaxID=230809 RepID=A0AAD7JXZ6_9AGAR|nr:hypothetical protein DFH07DRAFT_865935 [Mycena maculata]
MFGHGAIFDEAAGPPEPYDERDFVAPERTPPPDPGQHGRKRAAQWKRWQVEVLPNLLLPFAWILHETKSLRDYAPLEIPAKSCGCTGRILKVAIVRFSAIEDVVLTVCACTPAPVQLINAGAFACAPVSPSLAVDLHVLEFTRNLFVQIVPNNTAFALALERVLANMGFQLDNKNSLRRRFSNCFMWYSHLHNLHNERYTRLVDAARVDHLAETELEEPVEEPDHGRPTTRSRSSSSSSPSSSLRSASASLTPGQRKRERSRTPGPPPVPFPDPLPRKRPTEYLRRRCPACFGNLTHDPSATSDIKVCIDACFTQKKKKSPRDPPKTHPKTHFVPEQQAAATEAYVDGVRTVKKPKRRRAAAVEEDEEDGYEHPDLLLPRSVLDGCEASFKAADEKREKASTEFFEDTGIMALLCRHDRVLWLINMHSACEKQFNVYALMETLFQYLPLDIAVGLLYDVVCALERSCRKWGFLGRFMDRLSFAVSVFHAYGHEWVCQLLFHPRKRGGFGFADGEGCERFWHSISHLIGNLRVSRYHNRIYTLDTQIEHADEASLLRLAEWIQRRHRHSVGKRREATKALADSGIPLPLLQEQWTMQVIAQTKPIQRQSKNRGQQAVNTVILLRVTVKARRQRLEDMRQRFLDAVDENDTDATVYEVQLAAATEALQKAEQKLRLKESALGVGEHQALKRLSTNHYIHLRMNARALKRRLRDRLRARKFELDKVERSFRRLVNKQKLYTHTESAVKRREPTIAKINSQYNKLCADIQQAIRDRKAPRGAIAPHPISSKELWQLDVDDGIWQDVGLEDDEDEHSGRSAGEPPLWLSDEKVRSGIKAMLELDRCDEEDLCSKKERCALQVWFAEEWIVVNRAIQDEAGVTSGQSCAIVRHLAEVVTDLGIEEGSLPSWGPSATQLATCNVDMHLPARGEDRHYRRGGEESDDEDLEEIAEGGGEEEDYITLEAVERADLYRQTEENDY